MTDCPHGDPHCPCQDGDACHYEDVGDSKAWDHSGTYVEFHHDGIPEGGGKPLTDEQWLRLFAVVDNRKGWGWAMPKKAGDPVRVLPPPPDNGFTWRFDADGSAYREPFIPNASNN